MKKILVLVFILLIATQSFGQWAKYPKTNAGQEIVLDAISAPNQLLISNSTSSGFNNLGIDLFTLTISGGNLTLKPRIENNTFINAFRISTGFSFIAPYGMNDGIMDTFGTMNGIEQLDSTCLNEMGSYLTSCDPYTFLLLHMDGADNGQTFVDSSYNNNQSVSGGVVTKTSDKKFGTASAYFGGNGEYITFPGSNSFDLNTFDFTMEMWIKGATNSGSVFGEVLASQWETNGENFMDVSAWNNFDAGLDDGYEGGVFDGRYVYFAPRYNGTSYHGNVLRYDTTQNFVSASAWNNFDSGLGDGYFGGVFDGRYVYFVPLRNGSYHGNVLRYDTTQNFVDASAWNNFDSGLGTGYSGGVFDGRYVYFVPRRNPTYHSNVLRYDTTQNFVDASAWNNLDSGLSTGYSGGVFDGRYVYFAPFYDGSLHHGNVLRYDTTQNFVSAAAWNNFDSGLGNGYHGAVFDGRYVYFVPFNDGGVHHGNVLRYDTTQNFVSASAWNNFDSGLGNGYHGAVFDGRYVYFVPNEDSSYHGNVLRYDTTQNFVSAAAWNNFDSGLGDGYFGGVFDGRYVYLVPYSNGTHHGNVLRYDTTGTNASFKTLYSTQNQSGGYAGGPLGITFLLNIGETAYILTSNEPLDNTDFHHIAVVRNGSTLTLYVDGVEKDSISGVTGSVNISDYEVSLGVDNSKAHSGFEGYIDELRVSLGVARFTSDFSGSLPAAAYNGGLNNNMTIGSVNTILEADSTKARVVLFCEYIDDVTPNTDIKAHVSNNGGANYIEVALTDDGLYEGGKRILSGFGTFDSAGNTINWKVTTHNNKELRLHGWSCTWD